MNDIEAAVQTLRDHGKFIFAGILIGVLAAMAVVLIQPNTYRAEMIVGPTERAGMPSLTSFLPKVAADAPALQYFVERIDASQSTDFTVFETLIASPSIHTRIPDNIAPDGDRTLWFEKNLKIRPVGMTPFRKVSIDHQDQEKLIPILNTLFQLTDQSIRQDKRAKVDKRIAHLTDQLQQVRNPDHREAIIALLKEQEQTAMMVAIDTQFAAEIIEPAYILPKPVAPNPVILFPVLMAIGGFLGLMISAVRKAV
jgi:uncharacterized protein involved in exopolysaccharide biosynthesis